MRSNPGRPHFARAIWDFISPQRRFGVATDSHFRLKSAPDSDHLRRGWKNWGDVRL